MTNETYEKLQAELSQLLNTEKYKRMKSKDKDVYKQAVLETLIDQLMMRRKSELLAKIVNNSPICRNCDIYRDAWNVCFMASECLTNGFKFCKRRKDEVEE